MLEEAILRPMQRCARGPSCCTSLTHKTRPAVGGTKVGKIDAKTIGLQYRDEGGGESVVHIADT